MNIFEEATKLKVRFNTDRGLISTEDLWDLPLAEGRFCLDRIAQNLNAELNDPVNTRSFVTKKKSKSKILSLQFKIVKAIIESRLKELEKKEMIAENAAKKQKLINILSSKEDESLNNNSIEELQRMISEL